MSLLVVDADPSMRQLVRIGLAGAFDGIAIVEAETLAQARALLNEPFEAVILDRSLPDGAVDALVTELLDRLPVSRVIVHSVDGPLPGLPAAPRGDVAAIIEALTLLDERRIHRGAGAAHRSIGPVYRCWVELCRCDPALAPDAQPPVAELLIRAITEAMDRPQPLGWGIDPSLEPVAEVFGLNVGDVSTALAELVCLREAFMRVVVAELANDQQLDATRRLQMIIDRTAIVVAGSGVRQLIEQALTDPLTGLANRRAFDRDLGREQARSRRHGHAVTVAIIDVDGLKQINDTLGHGAGDDLLRRVAKATHLTMRSEDRCYRIGGDEFALLLADDVGVDPAALTSRLYACGAPDLTIGLASAPPDAASELVSLADKRLYEQRRLQRAV